MIYRLIYVLRVCLGVLSGCILIFFPADGSSSMEEQVENLIKTFCEHFQRRFPKTDRA